MGSISRKMKRKKQREERKKAKRARANAQPKPQQLTPEQIEQLKAQAMMQGQGQPGQPMPQQATPIEGQVELLMKEVDRLTKAIKLLDNHVWMMVEALSEKNLLNWLWKNDFSIY